MKIFGFTLGKKDVTQVESPDEKSFALPTSALDDGAVTVTQNAYYGTYVDLEGSVRNELELITRYREMSNHPELESAIDDIVNESITHSEDGSVVQINTDNLKQPESIKKKITEEYNYILKLLNFSNLADDLFRRWYIDGRIYFHVIVNEKNPKEGIQELRYIDPRKIRKIREINKERDPITGANIIKSMAEYYVYNDKGTSTQTYTAGGVNQGIRVATDSIINVNSGLMDAKNNFVISPLHSAIRPLNQLRMIEDAIVVYRLCLVGDTRVKTNTGWKYIKDINEGDIVYSYWGPEKGLLETSVVKQWKTGTKQTYKVSSKHFSITGTDNHPILVLDRKTNVIEYVDIKNIIPKRHCFVYEKPEEVFENIEFPKIRDKSVKLLNPEIWSSLEIPKKEKFIKDVAKNLNIKPSSVRNFLYGVQYLNESDANNILIEVGIENYELDSKYEFLPKTTSVNLPEYIDEEFARLYGFMLGDGTISKNGVTFAEGVYHEQNLYYSGLLTKYFGGCTLHKSKNRKYNNYTTSNTLASELFSKLGFTNGAKIKRFPDWIWKCSDEIKKQFILGFCDADGCNKDSVYTGTWSSEIELCNKQLIEDIKEMWTSLGLTSGKLHYRKRPKETGVFGNDLVERTINERESWYVRISDYELPKFETIYEVVSAEIEDVYELEVQSEKHNFIANGICVHNSRAPERRVFYIDVGNLPKGKAEQYLRDVMVKYRNKMTYDASTGCLAMDTKVPLLDGRTLTISEISDELKNNKELWTYSCDPNTGKFAPGLITWAGVTQKSAKVMKITFDNGKSLICTLNHKHVTKDRGFVEAKALQINDSMMPFYKRFKNVHGGNSEYEQIFENSSKKWLFTHRLVSSWKDENNLENEWNYDEQYINEEKMTVHHKNYNRYDNSVYNLVRMNKLDHFSYHKQHNHLAGKIGGKITAEKKRNENIPFFNISIEQRKEIGRKCGKIIGPKMVKEKKGIHGLASEETLSNAILGSKTLIEKLRTDEEFAKDFSEKQKATWTKERRQEVSIRAKQLPKEHFISMNKLGNDARWNSENSDYNKKCMSDLYTIRYTQEIINYVSHCAKNNMSLENALNYINENINFISWQNYNNETVNKKFDLTKFGYKNLLKVSKNSGYENYKNYCEYFNPKIKKETNKNYNPGDMNRIVYPDYIEDLFKECAKINLNTKKSLEYISNNIDYKEWNELNVRNFSHKRPVLNEFTEKDLYRFMHNAGFNIWKDYKESLLHYNHKIVNIEYLNDEIEVGTLTIDGQEKYHDYHTFALDCGIYTKNSLVDSRKHLSMLEDFFLPRREGCLIFATKIKLLDGRDVTLEQLIIEYKIGKQNWVYSVSPTGEIVPGKITWAGVTRLNADVLDVHLDNGEVITVTPDHKFILRTGEKVAAEDLRVGSSLMPLYTRFKNINHNRGSEYLQIYDNEQNKWRFAHTAIAEFIYGPKEPNQVTHHIDYNRYNQTPSNLVYMDKKEHYLYHCQNAPLSWQLGDAEKIQEVYPELNIDRLKYYINRIGGYESISYLIHRAIGPEYINKKRAVQINPDIRNHKVVKIVPGTPQNVGTLTIDENHEYHDYHNFGLSAGIFVMNSRGTEITTLPAGAALNDLPDLEYFKKKLLQSLHVPYSRMDNDNGGGIAVFGRSAETSRDELKFGKFIQRLRNKFSQLFDDALRIQLALKGICTTEEWEEFKEYIYYDFRKDNNFVELREAELIRERMITLSQVDPYIGKYFSQTWVKKNILRMTDEEIEEMSKEMEKDGSIELYQQQLMAQSGGEQPPEPFDNTYDSETSPSMTPNLDDKVSRFSP